MVSVVLTMELSMETDQVRVKSGRNRKMEKLKRSIGKEIVR